MVNLAADSSTKYCIFNLKSKKDWCPKKVVFIFCQNFAGDFFWRREFLSNLKPNSQRSLGPIYTFSFPGGVMGNIFWEKSSASPDFAPRNGLRRTKYNACTKYSAFRFRGNKTQLRIKIQHWFFKMMYMNASPLGISRKIAKILFGFWLISFCLQKTGFSRNFAGGTWERRRITFADFVKQIRKVFDTGIYG